MLLHMKIIENIKLMPMMNNNLSDEQATAQEFELLFQVDLRRG